MDDLYSIVVLAFVAWSVLGGLLGKKKGGAQAPRERRPADGPAGPAPAPDRDGPARYRDVPAGDDFEPTAVQASERGAMDRSAAAMIPDDLWEILTGERRPPAPEPAWEPDVSEPGAPWDAEGEPAPHGTRPAAPTPYGVEDAGAPHGGWGGSPDAGAERPSRRRAGEAESLETIPTVDYPVVVSLETPPPAPERRHRAFHEKLAATARQPRPDRRAAVPNGLRDRAALRRAVVLREVLGPPKALE